MSAWLLWVIIAGALAAAEVLSLDLVLIMLAGGAVGGAVVGAVGAPTEVQILVAIAVGVGLLVGVRPIAKRNLTSHQNIVTGTAALVGKSAIVLEQVDARGGRVKLNGAEWSARSYDHIQVLKAGTTVQVVEISGATALVWTGV